MKTPIFFELAAIVAVIVLARILGRRRIAPLAAIGHWGAKLGRRHRLSIVVVGLVGFAVSAGASAIRPPTPEVHDEFSYLLAADTFAHGRLTNPTHAKWRHFETFHVIQQPSYASKYPPAQGLLLALGTVLGGKPLAGVWIGMGLAAAALCWMLQGWLPGKWALFGGLLWALHPTIQFACGAQSWGHSYWGGEAPLFGGALMFGALPRVVRRLHPRDAVLMALGVTILANTRPFIGMVVSLAVAVTLAGWIIMRLRSNLHDARRLAARLVAPALATLALAAGCMAAYNQRVTGDLFTMPYMVHEATYSPTPLFVWAEPPAVPSYRHTEMRTFHTGWSFWWYEAQRDWSGFLEIKGRLARSTWKYFLGPLLTLPLFFIVPMLRRWPMRYALAVCGVVAIAAASITWLQPHYLAPALPLMWLLLVQGFRQLAACQRGGKFVGRHMVAGLAIVYLVIFTYEGYCFIAQRPDNWSDRRSQLVEKLQDTPGQHLVVVRYAPDHDGLQEWVYNAADIDRAKVVWAREMSPSENQQLLGYFDNRRAWLLEADASPPQLIEHIRQPTSPNPAPSHSLTGSFNRAP